jgi:(2Fe-2S) ferredoxin
MNKPEYHIFLCASFRLKGDPQGVCFKKNDGLAQYLENEILDRSLDAMISSTTCLKLCEKGPVMVVYPQNWWYAGVDSEEAMDAILDAMEDGRPAEAYLMD